MSATADTESLAPLPTLLLRNRVPTGRAAPPVCRCIILSRLFYHLPRLHQQVYLSPLLPGFGETGEMMQLRHLDANRRETTNKSAKPVPTPESHPSGFRPASPTAPLFSAVSGCIQRHVSETNRN
ncbi:unnamed protein product [Protopolystoma xenopodis]|uniref:Uncharacterized protein n=1 Tax=Protopolystoma xenopodis TaxID=117903 RepID=A0A3S5A7D6_9PLAT|nr:unnamed protein product [Protopolystoma xenopodis]